MRSGKKVSGEIIRAKVFAGERAGVFFSLTTIKKCCHLKNLPKPETEGAINNCRIKPNYFILTDVFYRNFGTNLPILDFT